MIYIDNELEITFHKWKCTYFYGTHGNEKVHIYVFMGQEEYTFSWQKKFLNAKFRITLAIKPQGCVWLLYLIKIILLLWLYLNVIYDRNSSTNKIND